MTRQNLFEVTQELSGHGIGIEAGYRGPARFRNSPVPRGVKECVEVGPRGKPSPRDSIAVGDAVSLTPYRNRTRPRSPALDLQRITPHESPGTS